MTADLVHRPYTSADVERLRGSVRVEHTLARLGAERLRYLLAEREWVPALGAMTGGQAVQMVKAGLEAIYLSGWQVAARIPTRACIPRTRAPHSRGASTMRSSEPIRSRTPRATRGRTGSRPSWPTPRRASGGRSMPSSS